jgi:hypothetical protein
MIQGTKHVAENEPEGRQRKALAWVSLDAEEVGALPHGEETFEDIVGQSVHAVRAVCPRTCGSCALDGWIKDGEHDDVSVEIECADEACNKQSAGMLVTAAHTLVSNGLAHHGINKAHNTASAQNLHNAASTLLVAAIYRGA